MAWVADSKEYEISTTLLNIQQNLMKVFAIFLLLLLSPIVSSQEWTAYRAADSDLPGDRINNIAVDQENNKWIAASDINNEIQQLLLIDADNNWTIYDANNSSYPEDFLIQSIFVDSQNNKWLGGDDGEIVRIDPDLNWTIFDSYPSMTTGTISDIAEHSDGSLYFTTGHLLRYDPVNDSWDLFDEENTSGFLSSGVWQIEIDESDNIWLGSFWGGNGLTKWSASDVWLNFSQTNTDRIYDLFEDDGYVYFSHGGLLEEGDVARIDLSNDNYELISSSLYVNSGIARNSDGKLWISYTQFVIDPGFCPSECGDGVKAFENEMLLSHYTPQNSDLQTNEISILTFDKEGVLWAGSLSSGLAKLDTSALEETGITDIADRELISLSPNPAKKYLQIHFAGNISSISDPVAVEIYNSTGKICIKQSLNKSQTIETFHLSSGIYFYQINLPSQLIKGKFIKQ